MEGGRKEGEWREERKREVGERDREIGRGWGKGRKN